MKTLLTLILVLFLFNTSKAQDSTALTAIQSNLAVVNNFLEKRDTSLKKISEAISFLNELTGIYNEFHGKYYGQFKPTKKDVELWAAWMEMNKAYVQWDKELKSVLLFKRVPSTF
jgi:hypothetical protein